MMSGGSTTSSNFSSSSSSLRNRRSGRQHTSPSPSSLPPQKSSHDDNDEDDRHDYDRHDDDDEEEDDDDDDVQKQQQQKQKNQQHSVKRAKIKEEEEEVDVGGGGGGGESEEDDDGETSPLLLLAESTRTTTTTTKTTTKDDSDAASLSSSSSSSSYTVSKWLILRMMGLIYFVAFWGAYNQNRGLMGTHGLQPANDILKRLAGGLTSSSTAWSWSFSWNHFLQHPTIFWFFPYSLERTDDDSAMDRIALVGMFLSFVCVFLLEANSWMVMFLLWLLDFSIVTISSGTTFYNYGWESQLLETGFLAIFLCQLPHLLIQAQQDQHEKKTQRRTTRRWKLSGLLWDGKQHEGTEEEEEPSILIMWLFRWLSFRISLGAGLIKIRGSSCWARKTCLHYHFETQPIPSPLSFIFHFLPKSVLSRAVDLDLFVQLYTSWFVLVPGSVPSSLPLPLFIRPRRRLSSSINSSLTVNSSNSNSNSSHSSSSWINPILRVILRLGGIIQIGFMINILASGNFAFLNHITIVPSIACLDDGCFPKFFRDFVNRRRRRSTSASRQQQQRQQQQQQQQNQQRPQQHQLSSCRDPPTEGQRAASAAAMTIKHRLIVLPPRFWTIDLALFILISSLSYPVLSNLFQWGGGRQIMNASFDRFRLVNTYGAFGDVGRARYEPIVSIGFRRHSYDDDDSANDNANITVNVNGLDWYELDFPCKPGKLTRRPCFCAPYHYRVDWNIWFIGFKPHQHYLSRRERWLYSLLTKILLEDEVERPWLALLDSTSAERLQRSYDEESDHHGTPMAARVDMYHYRMSEPLWTLLPKIMFPSSSSLLPSSSSSSSSSSSTTTGNNNRKDDVDKEEGVVVAWWNRTFEEVLIPPVRFDKGSKRLVRIPQ